MVLKRLGSLLMVTLVALMASVQPIAAPATFAAQGSDFVKQAGPELRLHGKVFRFAGSNNYYPMYKSEFMVDDVLNTAASQGFRVMRVWGSLDIGNQDGSNSIRGKADGVYFQYWDGSAPAYNDGADGLQHLDYVIYKAGQVGLRLVIPFVNNWNDFGGMDEYVRWRGGQYHDQFYTEDVDLLNLGCTAPDLSQTHTIYIWFSGGGTFTWTMCELNSGGCLLPACDGLSAVGALDPS
ncbi:MAG TPA: hypothetical protein VFU22_28825 [Roseiflexaceae bacterium]|nr:hypothetical protein [Roseiflexaceae bacterium]